jgi:hypothetical protein
MASDAHEDPAFQAMCREHEIEGTAMVALCGAFWNRALASTTGEAAPVAEVIECPKMGQQTVREIDGRWKFLPYGTKLYATPPAATPAAPGEVTWHFELLRRSMGYVKEASTRYYDGTDGASMRLSAASLFKKIEAALSHSAPAVECRDCCGTGVDGDCGPDGRTIDSECGACNGTGRSRDAWQVAIEHLERVFQKSVVGMVPAEYATGYTEALSHVRRALSHPAPVAAPAQSLLRAPLKPGDKLVCYCPPGVCQAPKGFSGPCNRAAPAPASEAVAWHIDTHGVESVAIKKSDLGLLAERYARPLGFIDGRTTHTPGDSADAPVQQAGELSAFDKKTAQVNVRSILEPLGVYFSSSTIDAIVLAALKGEQPVEPSGSERGEV